MSDHRAIGTALFQEARFSIMLKGNGQALVILADEYDGFTADVDKQRLEMMQRVIGRAIELIETEDEQR